ncbi:hypothetical protein OY671_012982, partial [Metschnikowia pulcherrima]
VGINPVVVHGGGPQIGRMSKASGIESQFVNGSRVTDKQTAEVAEMVSAGAINKESVGWIARAGGKAIGISGKDGGMVVARKVQSKAPKAIEDDGEPSVVDSGFVGEPDRIDTTVIDTICAAGMIPVIAPIGVGEDGATYNINAD